MFLSLLLVPSCNCHFGYAIYFIFSLHGRVQWSVLCCVVVGWKLWVEACGLERAIHTWHLSMYTLNPYCEYHTHLRPTHPPNPPLYVHFWHFCNNSKDVLSNCQCECVCTYVEFVCVTTKRFDTVCSVHRFFMLSFLFTFLFFIICMYVHTSAILPHFIHGSPLHLTVFLSVLCVAPLMAETVHCK